MGADIHYTVEIRDAEGAWNALYDSGLFHTAWWQSRFMKGLDQWREDPHGLSALRGRDYSLFGFLSAVRCANALAPYGIGTTDGWARTSGNEDDGHGGYGWPADISAVAEDSRDNGDYHSHGWMTLGDLRALDAQMAVFPTPDEHTSDLGYCVASAKAFTTNALAVLATLLGDAERSPLVGHVFASIPDDDAYDDPNYNVFAGSQGHTGLRYYAPLVEKRIADHDPEHVRILVCYDN